ncbi:hypothetical protein F4778DRAFT_101058 [Xylariomycetidae sp. FL2044]|nr:hypothetical protein F4778DRAFT_101058 [Xylariomycetidae sp. FL2044]
MNPHTFLLLFPTIISLSMAEFPTLWGLSERTSRFLSNPISRRSRVPQFILDTRHPWILEHQAELEKKLPDVEAFLCRPSAAASHKSEAETQEVLDIGGQGEVPADLFDYLEIDNARAGVSSRPGWPNALERLREIDRCPTALSRARRFNVNLYIHDSEYSAWYPWLFEHRRPSAALVSLFADVLTRMTSLETLHWGVRAQDARYFEAPFRERGLVLPSVRTLEPGPLAHYLVGMCPGLEALEISKGCVYSWRESSWRTHGPEDPVFSLIRAGASARNLTRFAVDAGHRGWTPALLQDLVVAMPGLRSLGLEGQLRFEYTYRELWEFTASTLESCLDILTGLRNLTHLDLPQTSDLDLGWYGGPWCGNAYDDDHNGDFERSVVREGVEVLEKAADVVLQHLPGLEGLSIGARQINITRSENGTIRAQYPWTGRLDEWLLEVVPRPPKVVHPYAKSEATV